NHRNEGVSTDAVASSPDCSPMPIHEPLPTLRRYVGDGRFGEPTPGRASTLKASSSEVPPTSGRSPPNGPGAGWARGLQGRNDLVRERRRAMRAAVVRSFKEPLVIEERPIPEPGPGQIRVRIETSGVCHTDIHAAHGDWPVKPTLPLVPGHEGVGLV